VAWTEYQTRIQAPAYIERARTTVLSFPVYVAGALAEPSSGTITITDATGTAVVSAAAVTITGSIATYSLSSATVSALPYGDGWLVEWALVMPDTYTHDFRQTAALVRCRLSPVITDADLIARHSDLTDYRPSSLSSWQTPIMEAWYEILGRLEAKGRRPYLVLSPEALRPLHLALTLELICRDLAGAGDAENRWSSLAEHYRERAAEAWAGLALVYDEADSNKPDPSRRRGVASIWLTSRA
jgi:hypothetical protein